jgi:benzoyl-CoA reductase/2-hydroxyglutaryl-CoA dehydratase subunit BcrC/BadD/HgdB
MELQKITIVMESLRELYQQYDVVIKDYRSKNSATIGGLPCNFIPPEILSAAGIVPLGIPSFMFRDSCIDAGRSWDSRDSGIYDLLIFPEKCGKRQERQGAFPVYYFDVPPGYGNESVDAWDKKIKDLIAEIQGGCPVEIGSDELRNAAEEYDDIRRLVRGISNNRKSNPASLCYFDLKELYEYASVFPPGLIRDSLGEIFLGMKDINDSGAKKRVSSLVYSSVISDRKLLEGIEDQGCLILEDDLCAGGRQFDSSHDISSPALYREILESFSFKPHCPCLRPQRERFDLMFSMVKKFGIDLVIFIEDLCCAGKRDQINFLKGRLMRNCVDTIVSDSGNILMEVKKHMERL